MIAEINGKLRIIDIKKNSLGETVYECACDCGKSRMMAVETWEKGISKHCGDCFRSGDQNNYTSTYTVWKQMVYRCNNGRTPHPMCDRWRVFLYFLEDMGEKPDAYVYLCRKDREKGFFKENCYWRPFSKNKQQLFIKMESDYNQDPSIQMTIEPKEKPMSDKKIADQQSALKTLREIARSREDQIAGIIKEAQSLMDKAKKEAEGLNTYKEIIKQIEIELKSNDSYDALFKKDEFLKF
jgi:hypothetical protein